MMALAAWGLMFAFGLHEALFIAFVVFLAAYIPIIGPIAGSIFPGLVALAQFSDLSRPLIGCPFAPRCEHTFDRCRRAAPVLTEPSAGTGAEVSGWTVACHLTGSEA